MDDDDAIVVGECMNYILKQQINELFENDRFTDDNEYKESDNNNATNEQLYKQLVQIISMDRAMISKSLMDLTGYYLDISNTNYNTIINTDNNRSIMNSLVAIELLLNSIVKATISDSVETNIDANIDINNDSNNDSNNVSNSYNGDPHTGFTRKDAIGRRSSKVKKKQIEYQQLINKLRSGEIYPLFFSTSLREYDDDSRLHMNIVHIVYILKAFLNKKQYCLTGTNFIGNCDDTGRKRYRDKLECYMKDLTKANIEIIYSKQFNCYVIYEKKVKSKHAIRDCK